MNDESPICYLCGQPLSGLTNEDHVPPYQLYAKAIRRTHELKHLKIKVHKSCNSSYQPDEDYFVQSLLPFARGSFAGEALSKEVFDSFHKRKPVRSLVLRTLGEFERRPSGIVLPPNTVAKRFEGERICRIAWKIVRGLYFSHHESVLPETHPVSVMVYPPDRMPPEHFIVAMLDKPTHGRYPGVFDYRFAQFPEAHNMHYWALLLWDRVLITVMFTDLGDEAASQIR